MLNEVQLYTNADPATNPAGERQSQAKTKVEDLRRRC